MKGQVITEDVLIAQKEFEIALRDLVTEIKLAYYDYLFVIEATRINEENQKLLQQMIAIAQTKFRVGQRQIFKRHYGTGGVIETGKCDYYT